MTAKSQRLFPIFILVLLLVIWGCIAPLANALNIGGDDRYELCNAQLVERRPDMAARLENDQPWLHTLLVALAFDILGENAAIPRLLTLILTFSTVLACWSLMREDVGLLVKLLFMGYYLTSNGIPTLAISAMLEPSAVGLAVIAVACSYSETKRLPSWRAYLAGVIMALAAFTKLTAMVVVVGWLVLLWHQRQTSPLCVIAPRILAGFVSTSLFVVAVSPTISFQDLWISHWTAHELLTAKPDPGYKFDFNDVFVDWIIFVPAVLGILWQFKRATAARSGTLFALAWLLTDFGVFYWHKPWWSYYSIHFQVPLAMLAAQGSGWVIRKAWHAISAEPHDIISINVPGNKLKWSINENISASVSGIVACIIIACWCGIQLPYFMKECETICSTKTVQEDEFVPYIRQYGRQANWIYVNDENIAFFGGVLQPPELVLRTYKRDITGGLNKDKIIQIVKSYKPEMLLLSVKGELEDKRFQEIINRGKYVRVKWSNDSELWVSPKLHPIAANSTIEMIKLLGI